MVPTPDRTGDARDDTESDARNRNPNVFEDARDGHHGPVGAVLLLPSAIACVLLVVEALAGAWYAASGSPRLCLAFFVQ
jgi:hypothetical protein